MCVHVLKHSVSKIDACMSYSTVSLEAHLHVSEMLVPCLACLSFSKWKVRAFINESEAQRALVGSIYLDNMFHIHARYSYSMCMFSAAVAAIHLE